MFKKALNNVFHFLVGVIMEKVYYKESPEIEKTELVEVSDASLVSDGYHTFEELYNFRTIYNALIFNEWAKLGINEVNKSHLHNDGELCFGKENMFIVSAKFPNGDTISNHYDVKFWEVFKIPESERSLHECDGHTSEDVVYRILKYIASQQ